MTGAKLLHYEITEKLGEGGMGVVYKARDTHLDRFVAIKVLPAERVADASRKARFVQEAKAASALNHPNIVVVHDIASDDGTDFIAMEYVAGKTLDQLIPRKGMRLNEALKIAVQIADALARAHSAGIIHRDLKPANIMVDAHGQAKVLDFGLAKLTEQGATSEDAATETIGVKTDEGAIVGTAAYMSPEQAEAKPLDARSDIFSFGSLLYEMVTGRRAFQGDSKMSTLSAVLHKEPPPLPEDVPQDLQKLITRCLRKDPERRVRHMDDVKLALEDLKEESESGKLAGVAEKPKRRAWRLVAATLLVPAAAAVWLLWRVFGVIEPQEAIREIPLTAEAGFEFYPSFSPDGTTVAFSRAPENYSRRFSLHLKMVGAEDSVLIAEPGMLSSWSPDGRWVAFTPGRLSESRGKTPIAVIPRIGGTPRTVTEISQASPHRLAPWTPDGKWLITMDRERESGRGHLMRVALDGGERKPLEWSGAPLYGHDPALSPDGKWLAFRRSVVSGTADLLVVPLDADYQPAAAPRRLVENRKDPRCPVWTADGTEIVFCSGPPNRSTMWRIRADGKGPASPLPFGGRGSFGPDIARVGNRLVYTKHVWNTDIWRVELDSAGRAAGPPARFLSSNLSDYGASWSPDGKRVGFVSERSGTGEIWTADADGGNLRKLTSMDSTWGMTPQWSPDGGWLAFTPDVDGNREIYVVPVAGGAPRRLTVDPATDSDPRWSRDGQWILFWSNRGGGDRVWKIAPTGGEAKPADVGVLGDEDPGGGWLYFNRPTASGYSIWRRPANGGAEQAVVENVSAYAYWATRWPIPVTRKGIYYGTDGRPFPGEKVLPAAIAFHEFATGKSVTIVPLRAGTFSGSGLSLSPDGRYLLYTQCEEEKGDLILVENFR